LPTAYMVGELYFEVVPKKKTTTRKCMTLAALRKSVAGLTQVELSERCGMHQGDISKLERRSTLEEVTVHTLRRYIEALGGEVQLVAIIDGRRVVLGGGAQVVEEPAKAVKSRRVKAKKTRSAKGKA